MKRLIFLFAICVIVISAPQAQAQGGSDWQDLWVLAHPTSTNGPTGWMLGQRQYTGLAYDRWRDVVYVVNPALCTVGGTTYYCPKIRILDANTGQPATGVGRASAGIMGVTAGEGGQLPTSIDTIVTANGWGGGYGSFSSGQFPLYKIDLDDEGRIFAGNLVSPAWGICFPGPPPNCDPIYLQQGPFRLYRWDTPSSPPRRVYATLNGSQTALGSYDSLPDVHVNSEMALRRWGDALDVVGGRVKVPLPGTPDSVLADSARIFVSGGFFTGMAGSASSPVDAVCVLLADTRSAPRVLNGLGENLEYRVGVRLRSTVLGIAAAGIAAGGASATDPVWVDSDTGATAELTQGQSAAPFPQDITTTVLRRLSDDDSLGTGKSGPLSFATIPSSAKKLLVTADGYPSNYGNPSVPNTRTLARVMNVTAPGQEFREPCMGNTPTLGMKELGANGGMYNFISDVDYKLNCDAFGNCTLILFVLMSNNGIGAFQTLCHFPVNLVHFRAALSGSDVLLSWDIAEEIGNLGFGIERSFSGGREWDAVGFVPGRGSNPTPASYEYRDPVIATHGSVGSAMYRLRQLDTDGSAAYSPSATVYFPSVPSGIVLAQNHPNPVSAAGDGAASIGYQLARPGFVTLRIFNVLGEEVAVPVREQREAGSWQARIDASRLPAGSYIYELDVDGVTARKTMIVVK